MSANLNEHRLTKEKKKCTPQAFRQRLSPFLIRHFPGGFTVFFFFLQFASHVKLNKVKTVVIFYSFDFYPIISKRIGAAGKTVMMIYSTNNKLLLSSWRPEPLNIIRVGTGLSAVKNEKIKITR